MRQPTRVDGGVVPRSEDPKDEGENRWGMWKGKHLKGGRKYSKTTKNRTITGNLQTQRLDE